MGPSCVREAYGGRTDEGEMTEVGKERDCFFNGASIFLS